MSSLCHLADDGSNERARVPPRQSGGSELLLGMHGFVGGQSQNSGRAPGLQLGPASCSMAWHAESDQGSGGTWWMWMMVSHPATGYVSREEPRRRTTDEAPSRVCDDQAGYVGDRPEVQFASCFGVSQTGCVCRKCRKAVKPAPSFQQQGWVRARVAISKL
jgi:hypothetical protein